MVTRVFLALIVGHARHRIGAVPQSIAAEQAEKAKNLAPHAALESKRFSSPAGARRRRLFPIFDSVYSGGGFTLGGGYRHFSWATARTLAAKGYKLVEAAATSPGHLSGHLDLGGSKKVGAPGRWCITGWGSHSPADIDTAFRMQQAIVGGDATLRLHRWVRSRRRWCTRIHAGGSHRPQMCPSTTSSPPPRARPGR